MNVSWVFDVISPFSYLGLKQLDRLPAGTRVTFVPVLFGALLKHFGQLGNAEIDSKRRFTYRFVLWRARQMGVPLRFPPAHPFNPLHAMRLIVAAGSDRRAVEHVFDAVFTHGRDVSDPAVIGQIARELGVAEASLASQDTKDALRRNTEWAMQRGVFGVPMFVIDDELFWGQDAFDMAVDYLRSPGRFIDAEMQALDALPVGVVRARSP